MRNGASGSSGPPRWPGMDAFPDLDRARVIELLNIYERETKKAGM